MICPKDVLQWFKTLESYKRIDTMCSLLEACLPFELRFLGTCLEELGRRDSPELRGMELRANNPQDLAADMHNCQKGEPTDIKIRRKMALYLALIRACNRNCVSEIFRTLECWGERDFTSMSDQDTLLELLLVYTMAAKHPVFSYHQHTKCAEILAKIKEIKRATDEATQMESLQQQQQQHQPHSQQALQQQQQSQLQQQQTQQQQPQHAQHVLHHQQQQQHPPPPPFHHQMVQMLQTPQVTAPMIYSQHWPKLLPGNDVDAMPHLMQSNITIPADTNAIAAAATAWSMRGLYAAPPPQQGPQSLDHQVPPQASSPMLSSQHSSPMSSRTTSPQRERGGSVPQQQQQQQQQHQQQMRSLSQRIAGGVKHVRRPSVETTPPPAPSSSGDVQHVKHLEENISEGGGLSSIIRNSFPRTAIQRNNANMYLPAHQQQQTASVNQQTQQQQQQQQQSSQQQQPQQHYQIGNNIKPSSLVYSMHNMHINDDGSGSMRSINSSKSAATTGSESGSSNGSCDERTPPPTPLPMQVCTGMGIVSGYQQQQQSHQQQPQKHHLSYKQQQQLNLQQRLNGRNGVEKSYQQIYATSNPSDAQTLQQQQQQQALLISPSSVSTPTTTVLLQPQQQQQQQPPPPTGTAYNAATYPYHTASPRGPPQTLLQAHNAPPPQALHGAFRFPIAPPHNGELMYQAYHAGLAFSAVPVTATPTGAPTAVTGGQLRNSSNPVGVVSTNAVAVQTVPPASQQQQQLLAATVATTPYSALNVCPITGASSGVAQKIISCYNCGSQTHSGRDCQEASMEDVTRSATYKLDYSTSTMVNSIGGDSGPDGHSKDVGSMLKSASGTTATSATAAAAAVGK